jgi:osmotically-inducible protein OsmY
MRDDESIKDDIVNQLYWDSRVDSSKVRVEVSGGAVTLSGTLPSLTAGIAAVEDAQEVAGVRQVTNDLTVKVPEALEVRTDKEVKMIIESMLRWNPNIASSDIEVSVDTGVVSLEGPVSSYWDKTKAEKIALETSGVTEVTNKLSVVPTRKKTDIEIAEDIVGALDRNINVDAERVDVKVVDGTVILSGTVPDYRAYRTAYNLAAYTLGVLDIVNNLKLEAWSQSAS